MIKNIFCSALPLTVFLLLNPAFALVAGPSRIIGKIQSFDENIVVVENQETTFTIPKDFVNKKVLKSGADLEILLSQEQVGKVKISKKKDPKK